MKYEMKHAKKQDKKSKVRLTRGKITAIILGSIAAITAVALCILYHQVIFSFITSKIDALSNWFSGESAAQSEEISVESSGTESDNNGAGDNTEEETSEEKKDETQS